MNLQQVDPNSYLSKGFELITRGRELFMDSSLKNTQTTAIEIFQRGVDCLMQYFKSFKSEIFLCVR